MILIYYYRLFGMFNVTAQASSLFTNGSVYDDITVIVTASKCRPPQVSIPINSVSNLAPLQYLRTETITVESFSAVNCSGLLNTKYKLKESKTNLFDLNTPILILLGKSGRSTGLM